MGNFKTGAKYGGLGLAGLIVVVVLVSALVIGGAYWALFLRQHTADPEGEREKLSLVEANGQFRVQAYDHFFDLCTDIQAKEAQIRAQRAELETNPSPARVEQINANLSAIQAQRDALINQYNNDGAKDYTIGQFGPKELFAGNDLPYPLNINQEATTCAV